MSSFPPIDWEVKHLKEMDTFYAKPPEGAKVYMAALLAMR